MLRSWHTDCIFTDVAELLMRSFPLAFAACCAAATLAANAAQPDPQQIIHRSVQTIEADWSQAPNYSYQERDVQSKHDGVPVVKTYEVLMIAGSQYNRLIAVDDKILPVWQQAEEEQKFQTETDKRAHESVRDRNRRIARYQKERAQDHLMLKTMVDAFDFQLAGEENVNGHDCWVLDATPKRGYQPRDRETRVLTGMRGRLWVDKAEYQWVRVKADVIKPVSFYGFMAKVGPGTRFLLEQAPVADNVWLPSRFSVHVIASALGFINQNSTDDEGYGKYRPIGKTTSDVAAKDSAGTREKP
jgi:hypothetical protein